MRHKCSKDRKKSNDHIKRKTKDSEMSQDDVMTIELLYKQINLLIMLMISNTFFYIYGQYSVYKVFSNEISREEFFLEAGINFIKANIIAVAASLGAVQFNIKRYKQQYRKKVYGKISYIIEPEREIIISEIMMFFLFFLQLIGGIGIYRRNEPQSDNKIGLIKLYSIELKAFQTRYLADYFLIVSTVMSITLIKSKYDEKKDFSHELGNPDIPAIIAGQLYVIQRSLLLYTNYSIYRIFFEESNNDLNEFSLKPNIIIIIGNIIGVLGNGLTLNAYIELYRRNVNQSIFGR